MYNLHAIYISASVNLNREGIKKLPVFFARLSLDPPNWKDCRSGAFGEM
jgi:hypothetical protein